MCIYIYIYGLWTVASVIIYIYTHTYNWRIMNGMECGWSDNCPGLSSDIHRDNHYKILQSMLGQEDFC